MTKIDGNILLVDDNEEILLALSIFLSQHFHNVEKISNPALIPGLITKKSYDVILLDMNFRVGINSGNEGLFWLREILKHDNQAAVVFLTAYGSIKLAVDALKEGATDFIQKPWEDETLLSTVMTAYKLRKSKQEILKLRNRQKHLTDNIDKTINPFIGESEVINQIFRTIDKVSATEANILILGENGTGKELVAREIHKRSGRSSELFVSVDLGAIPATLFESELFGHSKGAFTDAGEDKTGRFEIASGGTLFLDEIGNLPITLQPKLLTVLQQREIYRLGSNRAIPIDIRLISATNSSPDEMISQNRFREDLLYRINTIQVLIPPLRERKEDIKPLTRYFLEKYCSKYAKDKLKISRSTLAALNSYSFPGNVRELEHMIERAVILSETGVIEKTDLFNQSGIHHKKKSENINISDNEVRLIREALHLTGFNHTKASELLGISRKTLYNKIRNYGI
jgi:two-component system, NtrC family, response regulator HydG